jgi:hypothetical protein
MNTSNRAFPPMSEADAARVVEAYKPHTAIIPPARPRPPKPDQAGQKYRTAGPASAKNESAAHSHNARHIHVAHQVCAT